MSNNSPLDGWAEWSRYVLKELERNREDHKEVLDIVRRLENEVTVLKVKAGIWGMVAGALSGLIMLLFQLLR